MRSEALILALCLAACAEARAVRPASGAIEASYPEGPLYVGAALYYAEMGADRVMAVQDGAARVFFAEAGCGPTAVAPYGEGFLVLCHRGGRVVAVDARGAALRAWDSDDAGRPLMDPNDASADGRGGVYFTDPGAFSRRSRPHGHLMHLAADGALLSVDQGLWYPNGVFVAAGGAALYLSEHMAGRVWRYELGADGALGSRALFADFAALDLPRARFRPPYAEAGPDGLEIGPDGDLYVALYGEGRIARLTPNGALAGLFDTPARYVTNIAFDGAGAGAVTGAFANLAAPYPGEVRFFSPARLTGAPE